MVFAEDIRKTILKLAEERGPGNTFGPAEVAQRVDRENAEQLLEQVYFVASVLVREGKITSRTPGAYSPDTRFQLGFSKLPRATA